MIYNKMTVKERVTKNLTALTCLFPELANSTAASIFMRGWVSGIITADEFDEAKQYYGALWSYSGDYSRKKHVLLWEKNPKWYRVHLNLEDIAACYKQVPEP